MTILHIDEYAAKYPSFDSSPDTIYPKRITTQAKLTVSGTSQQSAAVNANTSFISLRVVGGAVYIEIGANPTASATTKYLADGDVYDIDITPGDKVAVISG